MRHKDERLTILQDAKGLLKQALPVVTQAPPRQPGRPRKKGARLPTSERWASTLPKASWPSTQVTIRGQQHRRLVFAQRVLWYETCPDQLVLMVLVREKNRKVH